MRKIVIVLLIVVSLVASLSVTSSAYYFGSMNGTVDYVPIPEKVSLWSFGEWIYFSDSPFALTDSIYGALMNYDVLSRLELSVFANSAYVLNSYNLITVNGTEYLEYNIDFDGEAFDGLLTLPIMNNSDVPLIYRIYMPHSDLLSFDIEGRGYNVVDGDLDFENFVFEVSTDSDEYIDSYIAQFPLFYPDMSQYDYIQLDIPLEPPYARVSIMYPLDSDHKSIYHIADLTDIDIEVIETPSFLNWLTRSVSAFLDTRIFNLGNVSVTLGVCLLVPLSLYFLIAFLKKFSGG